MSARKRAANTKQAEQPVQPPAVYAKSPSKGSEVIDSLSPPWSVATKSIVAVVAILLLTLVVWRFQELISPLVIAAIIAYLLNPLISLLIRRTNLSRGLAVVIVYLVMLVVVLASTVVLGFVAFDQVIRLADLLPNSLTEVVELMERQLARFTNWELVIAGYTVSGELIASRIDLSALGRQAADLIQPLLSRSGLFAAQVARSTLNVLSTAFLIFFISLYIAKDSPKIGQTISNAANQPGYRHDAERLMREFMRIWDAYLRGQVILGLVIGVVVSISLAALGVSNSLGLGILSGVLEFLPVIGPLIGAVAAVLVALFQPENYLGLSSVNYALVVLVVMIIIQQVENSFLVPRIVGDALDLHPIVVMVAVIMGASLAGILGAILAAPVVASIKLFGAYAWRKLLDLPPFPEPEPPPKPRRGESGLAGRLRLWRLRLMSRKT